MPQISVIVPVYKVEAYLCRCVDSILSQTFTDFELILVDDGSPDRCPAICDEYVVKDSRVMVIHQQNGGLSAARNAGIDWVLEKNDSEWLFFVDSDDWIHPMTLEALMKGAEETGVSVISAGFGWTKGSDTVVDTGRLTASLWDTENFYRNCYVNATVAWGKLYKKECFKGIRYPVGKAHEDEFITYKILFKFKKIAVISQPLYAYFQNPDGIMLSKWNPRSLDALTAIKERIVFFRDQKMQELYLWSIRFYFRIIVKYIKATRNDGEKNELAAVHRQLLKQLIKELWAYRKDMLQIILSVMKRIPLYLRRSS